MPLFEMIVQEYPIMGRVLTNVIEADATEDTDFIGYEAVKYDEWDDGSSWSKWKHIVKAEDSLIHECRLGTPRVFDRMIAEGLAAIIPDTTILGQIARGTHNLMLKEEAT